MDESQAPQTTIASEPMLVQATQHRIGEDTSHNDGISSVVATAARRLILVLGSALLTIALLLVAVHSLRGRNVDLVTFGIALCATLLLLVLVQRLHMLYLLLQRNRRHLRGTPSLAGSDPFSRFTTLAMWRDGAVAPLLVAALAANLVIFAYVSANYGALPPFLPLHYGAAGEVDRLGTPTEVYMMPGIGVVVLLSNVLLAAALHRRERLAAHLLIGAAIVVQLVLLIATMNIVSRA